MDWGNLFFKAVKATKLNTSIVTTLIYSWIAYFVAVKIVAGKNPFWSRIYLHIIKYNLRTYYLDGVSISNLLFTRI